MSRRRLLPSVALPQPVIISGKPVAPVIVEAAPMKPIKVEITARQLMEPAADNEVHQRLSAMFKAECKALGVTPTLRQARKARQGAANWAQVNPVSPLLRSA